MKKCLIVIPHIFEPKENSLYSSQNEGKRAKKKKALINTTIENLSRHNNRNYIHASLGKGKEIVTRELKPNSCIDIWMQVYTKEGSTLANSIPKDDRIEILYVNNLESMQIPEYASRRLLEQSDNFDICGYMEDDILIEDSNFFNKIEYLQKVLPDEYTVIPHRCESIPEKGDVILSGDPDGGRRDLFWDTKEAIKMNWPTGIINFYRAVNPHSGCFFITSKQARKIRNLWEARAWNSPFVLSGPLEQAGSGRIIEILKIMKPVPEDYRFLMVRHQDELWRRHPYE